MLLACSKNIITTRPNEFVPRVRKGYVLRLQPKMFKLYIYIGPYIASCITSSNGHKLCCEGNVSCMQHGTISFNRRFLAIKTLPSPTHTHFIHYTSVHKYYSFRSFQILFETHDWLLIASGASICRIRKTGGKLAVKVRKGGKYLRVWNILGGGQS